MVSESEKPNEELESIIRHEEVRMLYDSMPFSSLASVIASFTMFVVLYNHVDSTRLLTAWISIMLL